MNDRKLFLNKLREKVSRCNLLFELNLDIHKIVANKTDFGSFSFFAWLFFLFIIRRFSFPWSKKLVPIKMDHVIGLIGYPDLGFPGNVEGEF